MKTYFASIGEKPLRATQVIKWLHQMNVDSVDQMTNLSKSLRAVLAENRSDSRSRNCDWSKIQWRHA